MEKSDLKQTLTIIGLLFSFGTVLGCIIINFLWRIQDQLFENDWAFAQEWILTSVEDMPMVPSVQTIIWMMVPYSIIFLLGFWKYGKIILEGLMLCFGFLIGGIETIWMLNYNLKDGLLFLMTLFIRTIFMIIILIAMVILGIMKSKLVSNKNSATDCIKKYLFWFLIILIIMLVYIIFNTYVNLL